MVRNTRPKSRRTGAKLLAPTKAQRRAVEQLIAVGEPLSFIAAVLSLPIPTLQKRFSDEIAHGRARCRAALWAAMWRAAETGNVSAMKLLERLTLPLRREAATKPEKLGKKEQAKRAAETAGRGGDWGNLLDTPDSAACVDGLLLASAFLMFWRWSGAVMCPAFRCGRRDRWP